MELNPGFKYFLALVVMKKIIKDFRFIAVLIAVISVIASLQHYLSKHCNNFIIFRHSSYHFFQKANLYLEYPAQYFDRFLYNPCFALLFAPFAYLPLYLSMLAWVLFSAMAYYFSVLRLPIEKKDRLFILYFVLIELITSLQNLQSNALLAAAILFAFGLLERGKPFRAALFPALGFVIKGYGAVSGIFFFLKKPGIKSVLFPLFWLIVLSSVPVLFYGFHGTALLYRQWVASLIQDHEVNDGISIMRVLIHLFKVPLSVIAIQLTGLVLFLATCACILLRKNYERVKYPFLAYVLIWVIVFNHCSESATYVIAVTGAALWYAQSLKNGLDRALIIITFILTVLSPTDIFPRHLRDAFVVPYGLKALGPSLIWIRLQGALLLAGKP
jgi:hypothetical protein